MEQGGRRGQECDQGRGEVVVSALVLLTKYVPPALVHLSLNQCTAPPTKPHTAVSILTILH